MFIIEWFPGGSDNKESACNAEDPGSIPGMGRSPGEGDDYPNILSIYRNQLYFYTLKIIYFKKK